MPRTRQTDRTWTRRVRCYCPYGATVPHQVTPAQRAEHEQRLRAARQLEAEFGGQPAPEFFQERREQSRQGRAQDASRAVSSDNASGSMDDNVDEDDASEGRGDAVGLQEVTDTNCEMVSSTPSESDAGLDAQGPNRSPAWTHTSSISEDDRLAPQTFDQVLHDLNSDDGDESVDHSPDDEGPGTPSSDAASGSKGPDDTASFDAEEADEELDREASIAELASMDDNTMRCLPHDIEHLGETAIPENSELAYMLRAFDDLAWKIKYNISERGFAARPGQPPVVPGGAPRTAKAIRERLMQYSEIQTQRLPCCASMCQAFAPDADGTFSTTQNCSLCGRPSHERRQTRGRAGGIVAQPVNTFWVFSLRQRLIYEWATASIAGDRREYVDHVTNQIHSDTISDFWDSTTFQHMRDSGTWTRDTMVFALTMDGVTITRQKSKGTTVWPVLLTNFNDQPEMRMQRAITVAILPGDPGDDLASFLRPILDQLTPLRLFDAHERRYVTLNLVVAVLSGDSPAIAKLMGHKGTNAYMGCRFCTIKGTYASHVYFPIEPDMMLRKNLRHQIVHAAASRQLDVIGFKTVSPFIHIRTIRWPESFGLDTMHLISNVAKHFVKLIAFDLQLVGLQQIGQLMESAARSIPASVSRTPRNIQRSFLSFKAVEWFGWILQFSVLLWSTKELDSGADERAADLLDVWMHFVAGTRTLLKVRVTHTELDDMQRDFEQYALGLERLFKDTEDEGWLIGPKVCTSQVHALLHAAKNIRDTGPAFCTWQFGIERTIGMLEAPSQRHVCTSLANSLETQEAVRLVRLMAGKEPVTGAALRANPALFQGSLALGEDQDNPAGAMREAGHLIRPLPTHSTLARSSVVRQLLERVQLPNGLSSDIAAWQEWKTLVCFVQSGTAHTFDVDAWFHSSQGAADARSRSYVQVCSGSSGYFYARVDLILSIPFLSNQYTLLAVQRLPSATSRLPPSVRAAGFEAVDNVPRRQVLELVTAADILLPVGLLKPSLTTQPGRGRTRERDRLPDSIIVKPFRIDS